MTKPLTPEEQSFLSANDNAPIAPTDRLTSTPTILPLGELSTLPYFNEIMAALPRSLTNDERANWLQYPNPDLEDDNDNPLSPKEWLERGLDPEEVIELAAITPLAEF